MRQKIGRLHVPRVATAVIAIALAAALLAPGMAAAADPVPSCYLSTYYMYRATTFTIKGHVHAPSGQRVTIQIRKPGRTYWSTLGTSRINSAHNYYYSYRPKLGGRFYIRTLYRTAKSRYKGLSVTRGPGTKTQILLASTTSTRDSGLFERLGPAFLRQCPEYTLSATFVGSGAAIALGGTGDADVLLTHSPAAEVDFMNGLVAGSPSAYRGLTRRKVMYNDYVLVGPKANPAAVASTSPAADAFSAIATAGATFYSRNDKSGTNEKEKSIWALIGNPQISVPGTPPVYQSWYKASGTMGMAQALAAANESSTAGYTLSDRATWLSAYNLGMVKNLKVVNQGDAVYFNQYACIRVRNARNYEGAMDFADWMNCTQTQELIRTYGEYTYPGQVMFVPNADPYPW